jgi:hypothetical protein
MAMTGRPFRESIFTEGEAMDPDERQSARRSETRSGRLGIRFLVFPQPPFVPGYEQPEVVWLSPAPGEVLAGPSDRRIYVVEPMGPKEPYAFPFLPPYRGAARPPAEPGPDGHFDHLKPGTEPFLAAHAYACVRRTLDVFDSYLGREMPWFFQPGQTRLEIVPFIPGWSNAHSGYGYLELGESDLADRDAAYALNFDAIAHETGHMILLGELGVPTRAGGGPDFLAYHEAVADFVSLLGLLHFDTALDRILRRTAGNLLIHNELDRFAEISDEKQIRSFSNSLRLSDVGDEVHDRSRPFAGALFDGLLEVHQSLLFARGLSSIDPRQFSNLRRQVPGAALDRDLRSGRADYQFKHFAVKSALADARDIVGQALARSWRALDPDDLTFERAADAFLTALYDARQERYATQFEDCFAWREIL